MPASSPSRSFFLPFLVASLAVTATASGASGCASQGQGTNESFGDASDEGATEAGGGTTGSSSGASRSSGDASGSSSGVASGSGSGATANGADAASAADVQPVVTCDANTMDDPLSCGQCGNVCPQASGSDFPATPACNAGVCTYKCASDAGADAGAVIACGAASGVSGCFDPRSSTSACGGCGNQCAAGEQCVGGTCCAPGSSICGGKCVQLMNDPANCGACATSCGQGGTCSGGKCVGYVSSNPVESFIDACKLAGHKAVLPNQLGWSMSSVFNLPFGFTFFGQPQTQFWIGTQGTLAFGTPDPNNVPDGFPACSTSSGIPDTTTGYPAIVAFGDSNLNTGQDGVCFGQTAGTPQQFVVTWSRLNESTEADSVLTFSVLLTQGSNAIDLQYKTAVSAPDAGIDPTVAGANASVGMQLSANVTSPYSCNVTFIPQTPYAVHFAPEP
jgi:hypothetical protein